jgi:hypothetical protein
MAYLVIARRPKADEEMTGRTEIQRDFQIQGRSEKEGKGGTAPDFPPREKEGQLSIFQEENRELSPLLSPLLKRYKE